MFYFKKLFLLLAICSFLVSCSSISLLSKQEKSSEGKEGIDSMLRDFAKLSPRNQRRVSKEIDHQIAKAKEKGQKAVLSLADGLFLKANAASMASNPHLASFLFEKLMQLAPHDNFVKRKYVVELIRIGKLEDARAILQPMFEKDRKKSEITGLILAGVYTALDKKAEAVKTYKAVLKHHPKSEEACIFLAKSYALERRYIKANRLLLACEKHSPKSAAFVYYRGKLAIFRNKYKLAEKFFSRAVAKDPDYYQAVVDKGLLLAKNGKIGAAINVYKRYLKRNPDNQAVLSKTVELMFVAHRYKQVVGYAERLATLDPGNINLKVKLGIIYVNSKRYLDAIGMFEEVLSIVPDSHKVQYYLGAIHKKNKNSAKALKYFRKIPPKSDLFHDSTLQIAEILQWRIGKAKSKEEKEKRIARFLSFVEERKEKYAVVELDMAVILSAYYESTNEFGKAKDAISSARHAKGYGDNHEYYLASLYEKLKERKKAEDIVRGIVKRSPNNAIALNYLGYSMLERGEDFELAYQYIKKAVELKPKDGHIRDSLGWYYYKVGRYEDALREFKMAWRLVKTDVVITKHLASTYAALKHYKQAEKYYLKALKLCKYDHEREEIMRALKRFKSRRLPAKK